MGSNINRIGEKGFNTFGSEMVIIEYRNARDIDVYFPQYDWISEHSEYVEFKRGSIKCPYEKRTYGIGCLGEGEYKTKENGKHTRVYDTWHDMLKRCYDEKNRSKRTLTYIGCTVCEEWLNFQNFAEWYEENYYEAEGERMHLDKDILVKGNKIYSPNTCVFVPQNINLLFIKSNKNRGKHPIGVSYHKRINRFEAGCSIYDIYLGKYKSIYLGVYKTPEKAFEAYKLFKENHIKKVADYYFEKIPNNLYNAMYKYEVEITD